jgi:D-serine deaminase-like pyridoxal phosphate-dependent protein
MKDVTAALLMLALWSGAMFIAGYGVAETTNRRAAMDAGVGSYQLDGPQSNHITFHYGVPHKDNSPKVISTDEQHIYYEIQRGPVEKANAPQ